MGGRPCCCCPGKTRVQFWLPLDHRDLTTGEPYYWGAERLDDYDGADLLWKNYDGQIAALDQETIAVNCAVGTAGASRVGDTFGKSNPDDDEPGSIEFTLTGVTPSSEGFVAGRIVWTTETFNAADHVAHIAAGSVAMTYARKVIEADRQFHDYTGDFTAAGPRHCVGFVLEAPDGTRFFGPSHGVSYPDLIWELEHSKISPQWPPYKCWWGGVASSLQVIDAAGYFRTPTKTELRDYGLLIDPLTVNTTHKVGIFVALAAFNDDWTDDPLESFDYDFRIRLDLIDIYAIWTLDCLAAFYQKQTLTGSVPNSYTGTNVTNMCPFEMHGMVWDLELVELPAFVSGTHPNSLQVMHDDLYAFKATATSGTGGDITLWYLPCRTMVLQFHDRGELGCDTYVTISHDVAGFYWAEPDDGTGGSAVGDKGSGEATAPAGSGASMVNFYGLNPNDEIFFVEWHGDDCLNAPIPPPKLAPAAHPMRLECLGPDAGWDPPQCVQGTMPNQLWWMTNCYSLDPIWIGYRKRTTNVIGGPTTNGETCSPGPDQTNLCEAPVNVGSPAPGHFGTPVCLQTRIETHGYTPNIESDPTHVLWDAITFYFYVDISE